MDISGIALRALIFILAVGLLSCSKKGTEPGEELEIPMVFAPSVQWPQIANAAPTKSLINSSSELQGYSISILANAKGKDSQGNDVTYPVFRNHRLDYEGGAWTYSPTKYWISGAKYSFSAFAPFAPTSNSAAGSKKILSNGTFNIEGTDQQPQLVITGYNTGKVSQEVDARNEDLLLAQVTRDNTTADDFSPVSLSFKHLLSCVAFNIRNATDTDITQVTDITLLGVAYGCDITVTPDYYSIINSNEVTAAGASEHFQSADRTAPQGESYFLPKGMSDKDFKPLFDCGELTLLPQLLYGNEGIVLKFNVYYIGSGSPVAYKLKLGDIEEIKSWSEGKKYVYNMSITSEDILFQVVEVPWIEHEVEL